jgi:hypothetical protein
MSDTGADPGADRIESAADLVQVGADFSHLILSREDWHDLAIVLSDQGFYD